MLTAKNPWWQHSHMYCIPFSKKTTSNIFIFEFPGTIIKTSFFSCHVRKQQCWSLLLCVFLKEIIDSLFYTFQWEKNNSHVNNTLLNLSCIRTKDTFFYLESMGRGQAGEKRFILRHFFSWGIYIIHIIHTVAISEMRKVNFIIIQYTIYCKYNCTRAWDNNGIWTVLDAWTNKLFFTFVFAIQQ